MTDREKAERLGEVLLHVTEACEAAESVDEVLWALAQHETDLAEAIDRGDLDLSRDTMQRSYLVADRIRKMAAPDAMVTAAMKHGIECRRAYEMVNNLTVVFEDVHQDGAPGTESGLTEIALEALQHRVELHDMHVRDIVGCAGAIAEAWRANR